MRNFKFLIAVYCLFILSVHGVMGGESKPPVKEVLQTLGFENDSLQELNDGKILAQELEHQKQNELAVIIAIKLKVPYEEVIQSLKHGELLQANQALLTYHKISHSPLKKKNIEEIGFNAEEKDEVERFLAIDEASFNLSKTEKQKFESLEEPEEELSPSTTVWKEIEKRYRNILFNRLSEYHNQGLDGISSYQLDGKTINPGKELKKASQESKCLKEFFGDFYQAFYHYPNQSLENTEQKYFWFKQMVEDRPVIILAHRMIHKQPKYSIIAERQFYVGHTYDAMQAIVGTVQDEDETFLFVANRTFTKKITGFASSIAKSVGISQLKNDTTEQLKKFRDQLYSDNGIKK